MNYISGYKDRLVSEPALQHWKDNPLLPGTEHRKSSPQRFISKRFYSSNPLGLIDDEIDILNLYSIVLLLYTSVVAVLELRGLFVDLSSWRDKFHPRSDCMGFVVHKAALEQVSFRVICFTLFRILPLMLHIYISLI